MCLGKLGCFSKQLDLRIWFKGLWYHQHLDLQCPDSNGHLEIDQIALVVIFTVHEGDSH